MKPYQQRVLNEKEELDVKLTKLKAFTTSELFQQLPAAEQGRMNRQFSIMEDYSEVLGERIAAFTESK